MRKILTIIAAAILFAGFAVTPASAGQDAAQAPAVGQATPDAAATGTVMGGLPDYWDICAANGVGGTYWPSVINHWNATSHGLVLHIQNRCDGYSITNRFTFEYLNSTTVSCGRITNAGKVWSAARGYYIWNQNPVLWVNINDKCTNNPVSYDHQIQEYVGWLLGLVPDPNICNCVMGNTFTDRDNIRYVVTHDDLDMNVLYGGH